MVSFISTIITKHLFYALKNIFFEHIFISSWLSFATCSFSTDLLNISICYWGMGWCVHQPAFSNICSLCMCTCVRMLGAHRLGVLWIVMTPSWGNFYPSINLLKTIVFSYFFLPPDQVFQHTPVIGPPKCSNQNKNLQWNAWIWWVLGMAVLTLFAALPSPICQEFIPFHIF